MSENRSGGCGILGFLVVVALLVVAMFAGDWMYLVQTDSQTQIIIDKDKVKSDTQKAVEKGKEMVDKAAKGVEQAADETDDALTTPDDKQPD